MASSPSYSRIDTGLDRLYANRFSAADRRTKQRVWAVLCASFFQRYIARDAVLLDLGAGYCEFLRHIQAGRKLAVDLNPDTLHVAGADVEVLPIPFDRLADSVSSSSLDVVFASNVFEHLRSPDSLLEILEVLHDLLRPGGRLIVLQPNVRCVGPAFWDFVDHTLPLTEKGMAEALHLSGFQIEETRARFLPYTFKSRLPTSSWLVRLYLHCRPAQFLLGKQMLIVAKRPEAR